MDKFTFDLKLAELILEIVDWSDLVAKITKSIIDPFLHPVHRSSLLLCLLLDISASYH